MLRREDGCIHGRLRCAPLDHPRCHTSRAHTCVVRGCPWICAPSAGCPTGLKYCERTITRSALYRHLYLPYLQPICLPLHYLAAISKSSVPYRQRIFGPETSRERGVEVGGWGLYGYVSFFQLQGKEVYTAGLSILNMCQALARFLCMQGYWYRLKIE